MMMASERMHDLHDPWVTEYRGQFNYAIPQHEMQSFIYDYDNTNHPYPHPSARIPNGANPSAPPHPVGFYNNNGQYYDETGRPCNPPPPPPLPRKRIGPKKKGATENAKKNAMKAKPPPPRRPPITFNNVTVGEAPHLHNSKSSNFHKHCYDEANTPKAQKLQFRDPHPAFPVKKSVPKQAFGSTVHQGKRMYHPLIYEQTYNPQLYYNKQQQQRQQFQQPPKARYTVHEMESPHTVPPTPHAAPTAPSYSPFSTQNSIHVREVEPSPHGPPPPPPPPPPSTASVVKPKIRQVTPSPRGPSPPPSRPLVYSPRGPSPSPSRPAKVREILPSPTGPTVREVTPSPKGAQTPRAIPPPPPTPPKVPLKAPFHVQEVPMSPQGPAAVPPPPPTPPPVPLVSRKSFLKENPQDVPHEVEVRKIVPPPAFSREPDDKETIPAHTCTHQWHNDSELYWSYLPSRKAPPLECAMCFGSPHPNDYTKSFDPSRWLELNPKFYKYMPAQSLRKIPAAGKAVHRSPSLSLAQIFTY